jgi:glycerol-3-phosphate acyltransferase PlsX
MRSLVAALFATFESSDEARDGAAKLLPALAPLYASLDPENTGGAMLLGVDGVCIISHGSSSSVAVVNALRVANELVEGSVVDHLRTAISAS